MIEWASRVSLVVLAVLAAALASAPALGADSRPQAPDERIAVKDNFFSARSVTVHEGDVVRWVWHGDNRHNVTFKKVPAGASKQHVVHRHARNDHRRSTRRRAFR